MSVGARFVPVERPGADRDGTTRRQSRCVKPPSVPRSQKPRLPLRGA
jgi:hypothetical protein